MYLLLISGRYLVRSFGHKILLKYYFRDRVSIMDRHLSSYLQCSLILFVLCFVNLKCFAQYILELDEGDVCLKGDDSSSNHVCRQINNCPVVGEGIHKNIRPKICTFIGSTPVVCCPPSPRSSPSRPSFPSPPRPSRPAIQPNPSSIPLDTPINDDDRLLLNKPPKAAYSAAEMCRKYSELIFIQVTPPTLGGSKNKIAKQKDCVDIKTLIVGGEKAKAKEFPHMVLLGYDEKPIYDYKRCGGSLISERWVLTAGHCEKLGSSTFATWARVGELNFRSKFGNEVPKDYKIDQRILHPNYNGSATNYNDIALFRLEQNVKFSAYVRPLCLNTDQSLDPQKLLASGWGKTHVAEAVSSDLLKVVINRIPTDQCNSLYSNNPKLPRGINATSMICAGELKGGKDTCDGDSGGPLQISNPNYSCMYTQVGITSFGSKFCGSENTAGVYTRISNYISWIEPIVWPKDE